MATVKVMALAVSIAFVVLTEGALGQQCLHRADESAEQRSRRQMAVNFVVELNAAQTRQQRETGRYASLAEIRQSTTAPLGFVPRLVIDQFGYMIKVTDALDSCGFTLFSDEHGVVFEAQPTTVERKPSRSGLPTENPAGQDEHTRPADR
jgi:hypothetical protein